jgi:Mg2+ and Co2+ transporter CorA
MTKKNLTRPVQIIFRVDAHERDVIRRRMALAKTKNLSAFCRKMSMDGMIINVDYSQIRELLTHIGRLSSSVNQIAKRVNTTTRIYAEDIEEIKANQKEINGLIHAIDSKLL